MTRVVCAFFAAVASVQGCGPHATGIPKGPPPEYENPPLPAWDGGAETPKKRLTIADAGAMAH